MRGVFTCRAAHRLAVRGSPVNLPYLGRDRHARRIENAALLIQLLQLVTGSAVNYLYETGTKNSTFLPTVPEQPAIASVLSDVDVELAALEQRREKTRALKNGMLQEQLTGRTRLI